jgi:hypothetical protein
MYIEVTSPQLQDSPSTILIDQCVRIFTKVLLMKIVVFSVFLFQNQNWKQSKTPKWCFCFSIL